MRSPLQTLVRFALPLAGVAFASVAHAQGYEPAPPGYPNSYSPPGAGYQSTPSSDEKEDSGLGLEWVWARAEAGVSYADLKSFSASSLGLTNTSAGGPSFGVAAGVRLIFFTLGLSARDLSLSNIGNLWLLNLEAAFHTRVGHIDPYFGVRGGYNFVGSLSPTSFQQASSGDTPPGVTVHGWNVGPMFGLDFYLAKLISLGVDVDSQFLFLQRPSPPLPCPSGVSQSQCATLLSQGSATIPAQYQQQYKAYKVLYDNSGSSVGFGFTGMAHLGIHF